MEYLILVQSQSFILVNDILVNKQAKKRREGGFKFYIDNLYMLLIICNIQGFLIFTYMFHFLILT